LDFGGALPCHDYKSEHISSYQKCRIRNNAISIRGAEPIVEHPIFELERWLLKILELEKEEPNHNTG